MKKRITNISPLSVGKVFGLIQGGVSFVFSLFIFLAMIIAEIASPQVSFWVIFMTLIGSVFFALFQVLAGFLMGALVAFVYNLSVQWTGGIQVEVEDADTQSVSQSESTDDDQAAEED